MIQACIEEIGFLVLLKYLEWGDSCFPRSPKARDLHPMDEDQSMGTPDLGHPFSGAELRKQMVTALGASGGFRVAAQQFHHGAMRIKRGENACGVIGRRNLAIRIEDVLPWFAVYGSGLDLG